MDEVYNWMVMFDQGSFGVWATEMKNHHFIEISKCLPKSSLKPDLTPNYLVAIISVADAL